MLISVITSRKPSIGGSSAHGSALGSARGLAVDGTRGRRNSLDAIKSTFGSFINPIGLTAVAASSSSPPSNLRNNDGKDDSSSVDAQGLVREDCGVVSNFPARPQQSMLSLAITRGTSTDSVTGRHSMRGVGRVDTKSLDFLVVCRFEQVIQMTHPNSVSIHIYRFIYHLTIMLHLLKWCFLWNSLR